MAGPLPHSRQVSQMAREFLGDAGAAVSKSTRDLLSSHEYVQIYRASLAAHAVFTRVLWGVQRPSPAALKSIVVRLPLLIAFRQRCAAAIELRRLIELVSWDISLLEHPVEWRRFSEEPTAGFSRDLEDPIEYCARREVGF